METEGPLPHSQVPANYPYPEPAQYSPYPTSHFLEIHRYIILPSMPGSPQRSPSLRLPHQNPVHAPHPLLRATCPAHLIFLHFISRTILGEYRSLSSSLCNFLQSPVTSSLLGPNILLNILFSSTLSLRCSLIVSDQVWNQYKTTGKIIVLYISTTKLVLWNTPWISAWILRHAVMWRERSSIYV